MQALLQEAKKTLLLEKEGDMVHGSNIVNTQNLLVTDVAEHRDLGGGGMIQRFAATSCDLQWPS